MSEETTQNFPGGDSAQILALLTSIDGRLAALEDKVDRRLQDTRPIWEQVLARLDAVDGRMGNLEGKMGNLETEMRSGFRRLERMVGVLTDDVLEVRADQRDLDRRMDKLEDEGAQR